jgi:hypothetical protein
MEEVYSTGTSIIASIKHPINVNEQRIILAAGIVDEHEDTDNRAISSRFCKRKAL